MPYHNHRCEGHYPTTQHFAEVITTEIMPMTYSHTRWSTLLARTFEQIELLATAKGGEYSGDDDRLANFRRNAQALGIPKEVVWATYASKHYDALMQYIKDENLGTTRQRLEPLASRCDDLIVYLLLFKAMLEEKDQPEVGTSEKSKE